MKLTASRRDEMVNTLNGTAKTVYDAVPIQEVWSTDTINGELMRNGIRVSYKAIQGSLAQLVRSGLVKESPPQHWRRIEVRQDDKPKKEEEPVNTLTLPKKPEKKPSAFDQIENKITNLLEYNDEVHQVIESRLKSIQEDLLMLQIAHEEEQKSVQDLKDLADVLNRLKK